MKKAFLTLMLCVLLMATGCASGTVNHAAYVPFGENGYVMVDENGSVYTLEFPETIRDENGKKISRQELKAGDLLRITSSGEMLETYPGHLVGVSRIEVEKKGSPEDILKYQSVIDTFYSPPTYEEPPMLGLEYNIPEASVRAAATLGGYEWSRPGEREGEEVCEIACGAHVLQWPNLCEVTGLTSRTEVGLAFSQKDAQNITVMRWKKELLGSEEFPTGESVNVINKEDGSVIEAEPDYVYLVSASWPQGHAEYGFITAKVEK